MKIKVPSALWIINYLTNRPQFVMIGDNVKSKVPSALWIINYLTNRPQFVRIGDNVKSETKCTKTAPLLFCICNLLCFVVCVKFVFSLVC